MRVMAANSEEQREFAKSVLNVGDDNLLTIAEEEGVDLDWIKISFHVRLLAKDYNLRGLIQTIYLDHQTPLWRCHVFYTMQHSSPQKY